MRRHLWEVPQWIPWLGGILRHERRDAGDELLVADFYGTSVSETGTIDTSGLEQDILRDGPADVYLFSPMTMNVHVALAQAACVKRHVPTATTIFGGVFATALPEHFADQKSVDFVAPGLAGRPLLELLAELDRGTVPRSGKVLEFSGEIPSKEPSALPIPAVDLLPREVGADLRYIRLVHARGCPYRCSFCSIPTIGVKPGFFAPDRVMLELQLYRERLGTHHNVYFGDETFTLLPERTLELCRHLDDVENLIYDAQTRLDCDSSPMLLRRLRHSGCRWMELGIESLGASKISLLKGGRDVEIRAALGRYRDADIATCAFLINGLPGHTETQMMNSIEQACLLIEQGFLNGAYLFGFVPYPGSMIYSRPADYGIQLLHRRFEEYVEDAKPVYQSAEASADQLWRAFCFGIEALGAAMAASSRPPSGRIDEGGLGAFWQGPHV